MSQGTVCLVLGRASKKIVCKSEKALMCKAPILAVYDPNRETRVTAGASSVGLDAVLEQRHKSEIGDQLSMRQEHCLKLKRGTPNWKKKL